MRQRSFHIPPFFALTLVVTAALVLGACPSSNDPFAKADAIYDGVLKILRADAVETIDQKKQVEELLAAKRSELQAVQRQLEDELSRLSTAEQRDLFLKRFDGFLSRVREIQELVKAKGLDF